MTAARLITRLGVLGAAVALLLTGCTTQPAPPTPSPTSTVAATAVDDINPQPRDRLRDGGLMRLPVTHLPAQWNPRHRDADADAHRVLAPLTPAHFTLDAAGRAAANPDFVTAVDAVHADHTTVTLTLHPDAVWGDGEPVTAADWIATWRAARGDVDGVAFADSAGWERVDNVAAGSDEHQVVITYAGVDPDWAQPLVAGPVRGEAVASASGFGWGRYDAAHYASPFVVAHVDEPQGLVTLERNPRWWGDVPKLETIMFRAVRAEAVAAAFQHNELDVWETGSSADRLQQSRAVAETVLRTAPGTTGRTLQVAKSGVLGDAAVRRAVLLALDRSRAGADDLADIRKAPEVWSSTLMLPSQPGYVDQARATGLDADPEAAARALDEAGWPLVDGRRVRDGERLTLTFAVDAADPRTTSELALLTTQLDAVGITVRPAGSTASGAADLTPLSVKVSPFPLAHLPEDVVGTPGASELVGRVASEVDPVRRADQASQLARLAWQEVVEIPLYQEPQFVAVRNGVANLGAPGFGTTSWEDVGWTS